MVLMQELLTSLLGDQPHRVSEQTGHILVNINVCSQGDDGMRAELSKLSLSNESGDVAGVVSALQNLTILCARHAVALHGVVNKWSVTSTDVPKGISSLDKLSEELVEEMIEEILTIDFDLEDDVISDTSAALWVLALAHFHADDELLLAMFEDLGAPTLASCVLKTATTTTTTTTVSSPSDTSKPNELSGYNSSTPISSRHLSELAALSLMQHFRSLSHTPDEIEQIFTIVTDSSSPAALVTAAAMTAANAITNEDSDAIALSATSCFLQIPSEYLAREQDVSLSSRRISSPIRSDVMTGIEWKPSDFGEGDTEDTDEDDDENQRISSQVSQEAQQRMKLLVAQIRAATSTRPMDYNRLAALFRLISELSFFMGTQLHLVQALLFPVPRIAGNALRVAVSELARQVKTPNQVFITKEKTEDAVETDPSQQDDDDTDEVPKSDKIEIEVENPAPSASDVSTLELSKNLATHIAISSARAIASCARIAGTRDQAVINALIDAFFSCIVRIPVQRDDNSKRSFVTPVIVVPLPVLAAIMRGLSTLASSWRDSKTVFARRNGIPALMQAIAVSPESPEFLHHACSLASYLSYDSTQLASEILQYNGLNLILRALKRWMVEYIDLAAAACAAISALCFNNSIGQRTMTKDGNLDTMLDALRLGEASANLAETATLAIGTFCWNSDLRAAVVSADGIPILLSLLDAHPDSPGVTRCICRALAQVGFNNAVYRELLYKYNVAPRLLEVMKRHMDSERVQLHACAALSYMSWMSTGNRDLILENDGYATILEAMQTHDRISEVQEHGCRTLANVQGGKEEEESIAIIAVASAMRLHEEDGELIEEACRALVTLCLGSEFGVANRAQIQTLGVPDLLLHAMERFRNSMSVQLEACRLLSTLALFQSTLVEHLVSLRAPQIVLRAMKKFRTNKVAMHGANALVALCRTEGDNNEAVQAVYDNGGVGILRSALKTGKEMTRTHEYACRLLRLISALPDVGPNVAHDTAAEVVDILRNALNLLFDRGNFCSYYEALSRMAMLCVLQFFRVGDTDEILDICVSANLVPKLIHGLKQDILHDSTSQAIVSLLRRFISDTEMRSQLKEPENLEVVEQLVQHLQERHIDSPQWKALLTQTGDDHMQHSTHGLSPEFSLAVQSRRLLNSLHFTYNHSASQYSSPIERSESFNIDSPSRGRGRQSRQQRNRNRSHAGGTVLMQPRSFHEGSSFRRKFSDVASSNRSKASEVKKTNGTPHHQQSKPQQQQKQIPVHTHQSNSPSRLDLTPPRPLGVNPPPPTPPQPLPLPVISKSPLLPFQQPKPSKNINNNATFTVTESEL